eukprot:GCRY01002488.1.p1 GENE.GCRY01002488.1~~GCRY01002488.1.p1  ORF type:complete len:293 (+),score=94.74 GCRY01002488.1:3428-4306(+)
MQIKRGHRHVDLEGRVFLPYLNQWRETSSLVNLLYEMGQIFSLEPPVFAKKQGSTTTNSSSSSTTSSSYKTASYGGAARSGEAVTDDFSHLDLRDATEEEKEQARIQAAMDASLRQADLDRQKQHARAQAHADELKALRHRLTGKVQEKLSAHNRTTTSNIDALFQTQSTLSENNRTCKQNLEELKAEKAKLEQLQVVLTTEDRELDEWLAENGQEDTAFDPDAAVTPVGPHAAQIIQLAAEDCAIDDLAYYLDKALYKEAIAFDVFLKETRTLSMQQFKCRALLNKIKAMG